jgi:hypothetical protein
MKQNNFLTVLAAAILSTLSLPGSASASTPDFVNEYTNPAFESISLSAAFTQSKGIGAQVSLNGGWENGNEKGLVATGLQVDVLGANNSLYFIPQVTFYIIPTASTSDYMVARVGVSDKNFDVAAGMDYLMFIKGKGLLDLPTYLKAGFTVFSGMTATSSFGNSIVNVGLQLDF